MDVATGPAAEINKKRKGSVSSEADTESEEDEEGAPCAFRVFELAGVKKPRSKEVVQCTRSRCNFCKFRQIKTLASVTRKEGQAVVDKYLQSKNGDDKVLVGGRLAKIMSSIGWKI